jgi:hypothetical protein
MVLEAAVMMQEQQLAVNAAGEAGRLLRALAAVWSSQSLQLSTIMMYASKTVSNASVVAA